MSNLGHDAKIIGWFFLAIVALVVGIFLGLAVAEFSVRVKRHGLRAVLRAIWASLIARLQFREGERAADLSNLSNYSDYSIRQETILPMQSCRRDAYRGRLNRPWFVPRRTAATWINLIQFTPLLMFIG